MNPDRWLLDIPARSIAIAQCRLCGSLVGNWSPPAWDPDQRSMIDRHEAVCPGNEAESVRQFEQFAPTFVRQGTDAVAGGTDTRSGG